MSLRGAWVYVLAGLFILAFVYLRDIDHDLCNLAPSTAKTARQGSKALVSPPQTHLPSWTPTTTEGAPNFETASFTRSEVSQPDRLSDVDYGSVALPQLSSASETQRDLLLQSAVANRHGSHVHPSASAGTGREVCPELGTTRPTMGAVLEKQLPTTKDSITSSATEQVQGWQHSEGQIWRTWQRSWTWTWTSGTEGQGKSRCSSSAAPAPHAMAWVRSHGPDDESCYDDAYAIDASNGHAKSQCCCATYASASNTSWTKHSRSARGRCKN